MNFEQKDFPEVRSHFYFFTNRAIVRLSVSQHKRVYIIHKLHNNFSTYRPAHLHYNNTLSFA